MKVIGIILLVVLVAIILTAAKDFFKDYDGCL